jgi:hypothetical protein
MGQGGRDSPQTDATLPLTLPLTDSVSSVNSPRDGRAAVRSSLGRALRFVVEARQDGLEEGVAEQTAKDLHGAGARRGERP